MIIPVKEIETEFDYGIGHEEDGVKEDNCACHHPWCVCVWSEVDKTQLQNQKPIKAIPIYRELNNEQLCEYDDPRGSLSISNNGRERCE